jgi:CspA family cold shock protein
LFLNLTQLIMKKGTVKFFNQTKGYGFIKDIETSTEYFVHSSGLEQKIKDGDEVIFELQEGKKGINAVKVKLAE